MTEWSLFVSKANHSISQLSKSMPQPVTLKKLKLNGFKKTTRSFRTNTQKRCPFHYRGLECNSRKSRNTWSNRQIWLWSTEWSRENANRVLPGEHTGHSKHPLPTTQEKTTHGHHQMVNIQIRLILFFAAKDGKALYGQKKQDWADCGSDHEHLIAKFRLKLKKVGKTTRPFRYDLKYPLWLYSGSEK